MIRYADDIRSARMALVREALTGGALELTQGGRTVVRIALARPVQLGPVLDFATAEGIAPQDCEPDGARMVNAGGEPVVASLDLGADVVIDEDRIREGQTVRMLSARLRHA